MGNKTNTLALWLLALCPILYAYGINTWDGSSIICLCLGIMAFYNAFNKNQLRHLIPTALLVLVLLSIINFLRTVHGTLPLSQIQVLLCYFAFWYYINQWTVGEYAHIYRKIGIVVALFFYVQFIVLHTTGRMVSGIITALPLASGITDDSTAWIQYHLALDQCSSVFTEPSHLGRFLIPLIVIELFRKKSVNWKLIILLAAPIILSRTGTGIIVLGVLGLFWYCSKIDLNKPGNILKLIGIGGLFCLALYFFVGTEIGAQLMERKSELNIEYEGGSRSGLFRIYRGFAIFAEYDFSHKLLGTYDLNTIFSYESRGLFGALFGERVYFNGMSTLLLYQGFIGLFVFCILIIKLWKASSVTGRAIIVCYIAYMFCESVYPGERLASYLVIASCFTKANSERLCLK